MHRLLVLAGFITAISTASAQRGGRTVLQEWYPSKPADSTMTSWALRQGTTMTVPRVSRSPRGIRLLGPFGAADALRMTLKGLPRHSLVRIELGWHIIGPWQGTDANDRFMVMADGKNVVDATFSNTAAAQTWPDASNTPTAPLEQELATVTCSAIRAHMRSTIQGRWMPRMRPLVLSRILVVR
ncbi:MAG: hypothetical protein IPF79_06025 [Ignavibacteria bacterium]|nr:hypothetical protein [Ignavibacteria bacterium]